MRITALSLAALLLVAAVAVPAMADHNDRHTAQEERDAKKAEAQERRDAAKAERDEARQNKTAMAERCRAVHNDTGEVPKACKQAFKKAAKAKIVERCEAKENETGGESRACKAAKAAHKADKAARRAADHAFKALFGLEKRLFKLDALEGKFEEKLAGDNVTANQTAAWEAKLDKIDAAQNATQMRIDAMKERLEGIQSRWADVQAHIDGKKIVVCHQGDDGNKTIKVGLAAWAAHHRHGDAAGACEGDADDEPEANHEPHDEASGNSTASDPAPGAEPEGSEPDGSDPDGDPEGNNTSPPGE